MGAQVCDYDGEGTGAREGCGRTAAEIEARRGAGRPSRPLRGASGRGNGGRSGGRGLEGGGAPKGPRRTAQFLGVSPAPRQPRLILRRPAQRGLRGLEGGGAPKGPRRKEQAPRRGLEGRFTVPRNSPARNAQRPSSHAQRPSRPLRGASGRGGSGGRGCRDFAGAATPPHPEAPRRGLEGGGAPKGPRRTAQFLATRRRATRVTPSVPRGPFGAPRDEGGAGDGVAGISPAPQPRLILRRPEGASKEEAPRSGLEGWFSSSQPAGAQRGLRPASLEAPSGRLGTRGERGTGLPGFAGGNPASS